MPSPFYLVDSKTPHRPQIILWVELPGEIPVALALRDPDPAEQPLVETLRAAFERPMAGPPRRPARIRVAHPGDAAEVRGAVGSAIEVIVAPTPELTALVETMAEDIGEEAEESYLEEGRIPPDLVAGMFDAALALYAAAPWKLASDLQTLRMDIPALEIEGACVSIIGALGQDLGLIVFPSHTAFEAFLDAAEAGPPAEGPMDLGTTTLSLTYARADELPQLMRREAMEHGWRVAGPDGYPRVEHRDRDGVPRPLTEHDLRIATACARAVAAFTASHGGIFSEDHFEPASVTYTDDDDVAVRLTAPYEAFDVFEPEPEGAPILGPGKGPSRPTAGAADTVAQAGGASGPGPRRPGRNQPCWCGSGTKYKRCHLAADQAADQAQHVRPPPIHTVDERLVERMARFATSRFGQGWLYDAEEYFPDAEAAAQLFLPWAVYHSPVDGRPVVDWFLAEQGRRLSAEERSWLQAQQAAWLSVWEVMEVTPGRSLDVRDLLTGKERRVTEISGSRTLVARDVVLGRVVDHDDLSLFAGLHPRPLTPAYGAQVAGAVRKRVRRRRDIPVERLREPLVERYLITRWTEAVETMDAQRSVPPVLHNTDGDELLFTTDDFSFDPSARGQLHAALASVEELEIEDGEDGDDVYAFVRGEVAGAMMPGSTLIGRVRLSGTELKLETNSLPRADRLRRRLEAACGELLTHRAREHTSPQSLVEHAAEDATEPDEAPSSPELEEALAQWLEQYRSTWMDQPVPALGDITPREAARTRVGRERLDVVLKQMENDAARSPGQGTMDVGRIRAELGMED